MLCRRMGNKTVRGGLLPFSFRFFRENENENDNRESGIENGHRTSFCKFPYSGIAIQTQRAQWSQRKPQRNNSSPRSLRGAQRTSRFKFGSC